MIVSAVRGQGIKDAHVQCLMYSLVTLSCPILDGIIAADVFALSLGNFHTELLSMVHLRAFCISLCSVFYIRLHVQANWQFCHVG